MLRVMSMCASTTTAFTLALHDALPISVAATRGMRLRADVGLDPVGDVGDPAAEAGSRDAGPHRPLGDPHQLEDVGAHLADRSEEHTSELQSPVHVVCRLLLEKKNAIDTTQISSIPISFASFCSFSAI